jgi:hypothetical protein
MSAVKAGLHALTARASQARRRLGSSECYARCHSHINKVRRVATEKPSSALVASPKSPAWSRLYEHTPNSKHYRRANTRLVSTPAPSATPDPGRDLRRLDANHVATAQRPKWAVLEKTANSKSADNLRGHLKVLITDGRDIALTAVGSGDNDPPNFLPRTRIFAQ